MPGPVIHNTRNPPEPAPAIMPKMKDVLDLWNYGIDTHAIGTILQAPEWLVYRMLTHGDRSEAHVNQHQMAGE